MPILKRAWLPVVLLAALTAVVYGPSVMAAPSFDQFNYFVERHHTPSFPRLHDLDFSLTRQYWKGDEAEFRPLFFLWLAIEYALFGADLRFWHAAHILLHVGVVSVLYWVLRQYQPRWAAAAIAAIFAVRWTAAPLVGDPYLGGYLLASILLLTGLGIAFRELEIGGEYSAAAWLTYAAASTLAAFCFEVTVVTASVQAVVFSTATRDKGRWKPLWLPFALFVPVIAFGFAYLRRLPAVLRLTFVQDVPASNLLSAANLAGLPQRSAAMFVRMTARTFFPALRLPVIQHVLAMGGGPWLSAALTAINVCVALGVVVLIVGSRRSLRSRQTRYEVITLLLMAAAYVAFIRFGRGIEDDSYLYIFSLFVALLIGFAVDATRVPRTRVSWMMRGVAIAVVVVSVAVNSALSFGAMTIEARNGSEVVRYIAALDDFTSAHQSEAGFSFALEPVPPVDSSSGMTVVRGYPDMPSEVSQPGSARALFGALEDSRRARYVISWDGGALSIARGPAGN